MDTTDDELNSDGDCSLREAILAANNNSVVDACVAGTGDDTITLPAGTYTLTIAGRGENSNITGDLDILGNLTLAGADAATTLIDGGQLDRVIEVRSSASLTISNVTITNGALVGDNGGGLGHNSIGVTTLESSIVKNSSTTSFGGGISNDSSVGTVNINNSTVTNNNSNSFGGGVNNNSGGTINVTNSTVSNNTADGFGGGINNNSGGTTNVIDSVVSGNNAEGGGWGGGINNNFNGTVTVTRSTVFGNTGDSVGGINNNCCSAGIIVVTESIISGNTSINTLRGGGIHNNSDGTVTIDRTQVSGNTAVDGGGIVINPAVRLTSSTAASRATYRHGQGASPVAAAFTTTASAR